MCQSESETKGPPGVQASIDWYYFLFSVKKGFIRGFYCDPWNFIWNSNKPKAPELSNAPSLDDTPTQSISLLKSAVSLLKFSLLFVPRIIIALTTWLYFVCDILATQSIPSLDLRPVPGEKEKSMLQPDGQKGVGDKMTKGQNLFRQARAENRSVSPSCEEPPASSCVTF